MPLAQLEALFDTNVMSVHIKAGATAKRKVGGPGNWHLEEVGGQWTDHDLLDLSEAIIAAVDVQEHAFIEKESRYAKVIQLGNMRVVMTFPPLSGDMEITVIRPVTSKTLDAYELKPALLERLTSKAEGVLIAGSPGNGKTTFAEALLGHYHTQGRIIKTIEVPRDLRVPMDVTQYALSHSSLTEIRDLLLLTRPDYTFFDEIRNPEDFALFKDLRLTGIGMVGVIHAEQAIDAIQRCIGRIELGLIAHVIDTVVFINKGAVETVYSLDYAVRVPVGMQDSDLARPVIVIKDFETDRELFEIYTYGDQVVVMSLTKLNAAGEQVLPPLVRMGMQVLRKQMIKYAPDGFELEYVSPHRVKLLLSRNDIAGFIGKGGANVRQVEADLGIHFDVEEKGGAKAGRIDEEPVKHSYKASGRGEKVGFTVEQTKKGRVFIVPHVAIREAILIDEQGKETHVSVSRGGVIKIPQGPLVSKVQRGKITVLKAG